jgi:hypothetical protein
MEGCASMGVGAIRATLGRFAVVAVVAMAILLLLAGSASAAFSVTPSRTFPIGTFQFGGYAPGFDGTFWTVATGAESGGSVNHYDDEGHNLGDGFEFPFSAALGIGYYGGRVYIPLATSSGRMVGVNVNNPEEILTVDEETGRRMGSTQVILRTYPDGAASVGFGQINKVASLDLNDNSADHPWYPQAFYGNGINDAVYKVAPEGNAFETCRLGLGGAPVSGEPEKCGIFGGYHPDSTHAGFYYARDTAFGLGGMYVAESYGNKITHINTVANPGAVIDMEFGIGPGSGAGQLSGPVSVAVQPGTGYVYVSEAGNFRISVFDGQGHYLNSFGYGVSDGKDAMEVCGLEIGPCQAGVSYLSEPRSLFDRLDFGPEGELFAYMPLTGQIQVFSVAGGPGGAGAPAGGSGPAAGVQRVRLRAHPIKVDKGKKTTLTAIVNFGKDCANRKVLFQVKAGRGWDNLGKAAKTGRGCTASKRVKVTSKSVYRAVLIDSTNQQTLGYSPRVTVKLK